MQIELYGATASNFGAQLMAQAAAAELRQRIPGLELYLFPERDGHELMRAIDAGSVIPTDRRGGLLRVLPSIGRIAAPGRWQAVKERYRLLESSSMDALLDLSGFRLSDQWGPDVAEQFATTIDHFASRGIPVVLLPQAFGPFTNRDVRKSARRALDQVRLIYARDSTSADYLGDLNLRSEVRRAPDFTTSVGLASDGSVKRQLSIVPNARVIDRPGHGWSKERYIGLLASLVQAGAELGLDVRIVLHTGEPADDDLARRVVSRAQQNGPVKVAIEHPRGGLEAKQTLAASSVVVASRYHAVASALASGRPVLSLGWSHKYAGLLQDWGVPELAIGPEQSPVEIVEHLQRLVNGSEGERVESTLRRSRQAVMKKTHEMWEGVVSAFSI